MTAWQRTKVTVREERGFGPFSFKRLLVAGGSAGVFAMTMLGPLGPLVGCTSTVLLFALILFLTHPKDGMSMMMYLLYASKGLATLAAVQERSGAWAWIASLLDISSEQGMIDADALFNAVYSADEDEALLDEGGWIFHDDFDTIGDESGFQIIDPFNAPVAAPSPASGGAD